MVHEIMNFKENKFLAGKGESYILVIAVGAGMKLTTGGSSSTTDGKGSKGSL